jgi:DNA-directed RNA polymerase specialized sigma24 family protein
VPADDQVPPLTEVSASTRYGAAAFTTTHWSVVLEAQGESPAAQEALERLCRIYWRPIYSFVRRQGFGREKAEDLTQGLFAQLLERKRLSDVRKEKGRLRSFLLGALKYFLADEQRRAMAIKRGKGQRLYGRTPECAEDSKRSRARQLSAVSSQESSASVPLAKCPFRKAGGMRHLSHIDLPGDGLTTLPGAVPSAPALRINRPG